VQNPDLWEALSRAECQRLKSLENFDDETFTFIYHKNDRSLTTRDFRAHVYGKCIMGSVTTEMIWGNFAIGCVLPQPSGIDYVGHGWECDNAYSTDAKHGWGSIDPRPDASLPATSEGLRVPGRM
jgi:hypothetical protein